jgi:hypothetical protein
VTCYTTKLFLHAKGLFTNSSFTLSRAVSLQWQLSKPCSTTEASVITTLDTFVSSY